MKYPRTARIFRGQLDAAPFAGVLFVLLMFVLLCSMIYTPGVRIELPVAGLMGAPSGVTVEVAVDSRGNYFYKNQPIEADKLRDHLTDRVKKSPEPLALMVRADRAVTLEKFDAVVRIAHESGINEIWQATLPRLFDSLATGGTNGLAR